MKHLKIFQLYSFYAPVSQLAIVLLSKQGVVVQICRASIVLLICLHIALTYLLIAVLQSSLSIKWSFHDGSIWVSSLFPVFVTTI